MGCAYINFFLAGRQYWGETSNCWWWWLHNQVPNVGSYFLSQLVLVTCRAYMCEIEY